MSDKEKIMNAEKDPFHKLQEIRKYCDNLKGVYKYTPEAMENTIANTILKIINR